MLSDILNILKFFTDSQTRDTMKAIKMVASSRQKDWRKNVHHVREQFSIANWMKINAFTNDLFERVQNTDISQEKYRRFTTVYSELINNAHDYGCRTNPKCKIIVDCIYSRWFIQLEIKDGGNGFDLHDSLEAVQKQRDEGKRKGKSGLEIVMDLSDKFEVKKTCIVVVIAGEDRIKTHTAIEKINEADLLLVTVEEDREWSFLAPSWQPLRDTLEKATQPLILVRFGKSSEKSNERVIVLGNFGEKHSSEAYTKAQQPKEKFFIEDSHVMRITNVRGRAKPIIIDCALDKNHHFAYITPDRWVYDDLKELETANLKFFRNTKDAYYWLRESIHQGTG